MRRFNSAHKREIFFFISVSPDPSLARTISVISLGILSPATVLSETRDLLSTLSSTQ